MAADIRIGTAIKRARERRRWTQRQLADALGVDIKTVDNWENGRTRPRNRIGALEEVLGVSLDGDAAPPEELVPGNDWEAWVLAHPDIPDQIRRDIVLRNRAAAESRRSRPRQAG